MIETLREEVNGLLPEIEDVSVLLDAKTKSESTIDPFSVPAEEILELNGFDKNFKRRGTRALKKRFTGVDGARSTQLNENPYSGYSILDVIEPPYDLDNLSKLYEISTPHKAAVDAKCSNIVGLGYEFQLYGQVAEKIEGMNPKRKESYDKKVKVWKRKLLEHIDDLNDEDTFEEILLKIWKDYECTGNGYLEISRTSTGKIGYIGHIPSKTMRIRRDRDGFIQMVSNEIVFFRNFGSDDPSPINGEKNPSEAIHFKKYAPSNTYYGVPDIVSATSAIAGDTFSSKYNLEYFENKAVPRHLILLKGARISPALTQKVLSFFEVGLKGKNHRAVFIPLPSSTNENKVDLEIKSIESGKQESSFANYKKENRMEVLMAHRVPISKVSLPEGVSLAVARDSDKTFKEQVCGPEQKTLNKKLNKLIKAIQGDQIIFLLKLNELTLTDEQTQSQIDERRIKTRTETPDEQRARRGQAPLSDGSGNKVVDIGGGNTGARDAQRSAAATDSTGNARNPKGEGRTNNVK